MEPERSEETEAARDFVCAPARSSQAKLCGARLRKRPGEFCRKPVMLNATRCVQHGARSLKGSAHPRWKGGAFSKYLPRDLRQRYEKWLSSPDLLAGRNEVAMLKSRIEELAGRLDNSNESGESWRALQEAFAELKRATAAGDEAATATAVTRLQAIIDGAVSNEAAWDAFTDLVERATLIAQRETKRQADERVSVGVDQVRLVFSSLAECILREVRDPQTRAAIVAHIERMRILGAGELDTVT